MEKEAVQKGQMHRGRLECWGKRRGGAARAGKASNLKESAGGKLPRKVGGKKGKEEERIWQDFQPDRLSLTEPRKPR